METMHAAGRRRLPPVPRPGGDRPAAGVLTAEAPPESPAPVVEAVDAVGAVEATAPSAAADDASDTAVIDTRVISADLIDAELARLVDQAAPAADPAGEAVDPVEKDRPAEHGAVEQEAVEQEAVEQEAVEQEAVEPDPAQEFVTRLRNAAADFAGAAGAETAVVREAVPPARHRRARCRLVLRYADGREIDVTMLGPAGAPGRPSRHGFDRQILRWLGSGLLTDDAWMVSDPDAPGGIAVDLTAWVARP